MAKFFEIGHEMANLVTLLLILDDLNERMKLTGVWQINSLKVIITETSASYSILQNLFNGKGQRTISLKNNHIMAVKKHRDGSQIICSAKHAYSGKVKPVEEAFVDTSYYLFRYLLFDVKQWSPPDKFHLRTSKFLLPKRQRCTYFRTPYDSSRNDSGLLSDWV